jgi:predicted DNA-binding transcriptional regulator AlpA
MVHRYLTDEEVAERLHRSIHTIRKALTAETIPSAVVLGRRLVREDWLDAFVESQSTRRPRRLGRAS